MREILFLFVIVSVTMTAVQATAQFNPESQIAQENQKPTIAITTFKHPPLPRKRMGGDEFFGELDCQTQTAIRTIPRCRTTPGLRCRPRAWT